MLNMFGSKVPTLLDASLSAQDVPELIKGMQTFSVDEVGSWLSNHGLSREQLLEAFKTGDPYDVAKTSKLLHKAARTNNEQVLSCVFQMFNTSWSYEEFGQPLLHVVAMHCSVATLKIMVDQGAGLDITDEQGMNVLMYLIHAADEPKTDIIKFLISRGVDVDMVGNAESKSGIMPVCGALHFAVLSPDKIPLASALIEGGASVNLLSESSNRVADGTPLHVAVRYGNVAAADLLLEHGADVSVLDPCGATPFHMAVFRHKSRYGCMTRLFLQWNVSMEVKNGSGRTPLEHALMNWTDVPIANLKMLLQAGSRCTQDFWNSIIVGSNVQKGQEMKLEEVEKMLNKLAFSPRSLQDIATFKIRALLGRSYQWTVDELPVPDNMKRIIDLQHLV